MPTDWAAKVRDAITNLEIKTGRVLEPDRSLALIDDVVAGKFAAGDLATIHGMPQEWICTTLGHVTRAVGKGRVRPLEAGGWYAFQGHDHPYKVAPGFPLPGSRRVAWHDKALRAINTDIARGGISWAEFARPDKIDWLACRRSRHHALGHVCRFRGSRRRDPRHLGARGRGVGRHCRLFPGITDNVRARECARTIAGWKPLPAAACQISRSRLRRNRARLTKP